MLINHNELKEFLDYKYQEFNVRDFIVNDPICIPHRFSLKEDVEIAGFIAAILAWGNRKSIISSCDKIFKVMGESPYDFVLQYSPQKSKTLTGLKHRTFNEFDLDIFIRSLAQVYAKHGSLEKLFFKALQGREFGEGIGEFKKEFLGEFISTRTQKHLSNPLQNSSAKRLCMYLRWMVRKDAGGVDLGIWSSISPAVLHLPLDVHTGNISRKLGLLKRTQNDWKAVQEITQQLQVFCPEDPIKYDFALFGLGAIEKF